MSNINLLQKLQTWIAAALIFLMPIFFLPFTADFYDLNKQMLLLVGTTTLFILYFIEAMVTKTIMWRKTPFALPLVLFVGAMLLSVFMASANKMEAFANPIGAANIICLTILSLLISQQTESSKKILSIALTLSALVLSLLTFQQFVGISKTIFTTTRYLQDRAWTPTGNVAASFIYLLTIIVISLPKVFEYYRKEKTVSTALYAFSIVIMLIGAGINLYSLLVFKKALFLPLQTGWYIALESLKNHLIFGWGLENFLGAFTTSRPLAFNSTPLWNLRFVTSSNLYLHIWTTLGVLGLGTFLMFVLTVVKHFKNNPTQIHKNTVPLLLVLILGFIFPPSLLFLFLLYILTGLHSGEYENKTLRTHTTPMYIILGLPLILLLFMFYRSINIYRADIAFKQSLNALSQNKGSQTYEKQRQAIQLAPWKDTYRNSLAQVNLALANAIAGKGNLTDQERNTLSQLIQQSIQEGKNAIVLNRLKITNWENLATIYKQLINVAKSADQWSVSTYAQAVSLDPYNPVLRIELGGIFYARQNFDEAINQFSIAVRLKPDFANAHYNLSSALKQKKEYSRAISEMEAVLKLVGANSKDYQKAQSELDELKKLQGNQQVTKTQNPPSETLTDPNSPNTQVTPPLDLPEEAAPPATISANKQNEKPKASPNSSGQESTQPSATP